MNEFVDMHVHSKFSIDGMSTMEDYCLIAGKTGTRVICFTEHVDFNSAEKNLSIVKDNRKQNFVVDDYFREINRLRKKYGSLTLLSGIEFSEPSLFPEEFALYSSYPFDCITAGIHHCYNSVFPGAGNLSVSKAIYEYYQIMQKTVELRKNNNKPCRFNINYDYMSGLLTIDFCIIQFEKGDKIMMLQARNVSIYISKDDRLLIDDFSFALNQSDKVAIIGEEGNGKSTLLKLLYSEETVGNYVHHTGEIIRDGILAYLPQFMGENDQLLTVAEYLADTDFYDDYNIINSLGLEYELLFSTQKISTLSGGEKIKIQLLKLLSDKPDALLLDEPSNDLDIDTLIFLESFIRDSAIPIIFISHDEMLISSCANVIIHIEQLIRKTKCSITVSRLTYEDYLKFRNLQFDRQNQIAHKERSEYKKKRERLLQLYEKARHNTGWKNPDGIASSDGHAKKACKP